MIFSSGGAFRGGAETKHPNEFHNETNPEKMASKKSVPKRAPAKKKPAAKKKATPKKKVEARKAPVNKGTAKKKEAGAKKSPAGNTKKKLRVTAEQRYQMVRDAAYYIAEKEDFLGNAIYHWVEAEKQIDARVRLK